MKHKQPMEKENALDYTQHELVSILIVTLLVIYGLWTFFEVQGKKPRKKTFMIIVILRDRSCPKENDRKRKESLSHCYALPYSSHGMFLSYLLLKRSVKF